MTQIIGSIERGAYVARLPSHGLVVRVPLEPIGRRVGGVEIGAVCAQLGTTQVGGWWSKFKKGVKKSVKKTVSVAKKIAHNKIVKQLYETAKSLAPSPLNQILGAVETGVKFGKALAGGSKAAKAALPIVKSLAAGKLSLAAAQKLAPKGIKPTTIRDAAATLKLKQKARTNPQVAKLFAGVARIEATNKLPSSRPSRPMERIITTRSGKRFAVQIRPAA